jgi:hypothetical protein
MPHVKLLDSPVKNSHNITANLMEFRKALKENNAEFHLMSRVTLMNATCHNIKSFCLKLKNRHLLYIGKC